MRSTSVLRRVTCRHALPLVLGVALFFAGGFAHAQDTQSVAEAARRAREQKKAQAKPAKVITDESLDVKKGDVQSAAAEQLRVPGTPEPQPQPTATSTNSSATQSPKNPAEDEKVAKERAELKEQIKQVQSDIDLAQRELRLQQDSFFSSPDYSHNTAGKAKLDGLKQQISDKQEDLEKLKSRLAALPPAKEEPAATPPKS